MQSFSHSIMQNLPIEIAGLTKSFGKQLALQDISLRFGPQRVVAVVGHNGSGKTTLMKCLLGLVIPDRGQVRLYGQPVDASGAYRHQLGYMPQISRYPEHLKVGQLFAMMTDIRRHSPVRPPAGKDEELVQSFGLASFFDKPMRSLSGGMKQKVGAALAFLFDPPILILDEPTAGLDPLACEVLKAKIATAQAAGKLILITSHIMNDLDELATDVLYLNEGRVDFFKPLADLRAETGEERLGRIIARLMHDQTPPDQRPRYPSQWQMHSLEAGLYT
jgi:Cu-processing system ATP-binding protein